MSQTSFDFRPPVTTEERRALAALEACYRMARALTVDLGIDEITIVRGIHHRYNAPGTTYTIGSIMDEAEAVLDAAKARQS